MNIEIRALNIRVQLSRAGLRKSLGSSAASYWIASQPIEKEWTVVDLANFGETTPATTSRCLRQMLELGLAEESNRKGRTVFYRFTRAAYRMGFPQKFKNLSHTNIGADGLENPCLESVE